MKLKWILGFLLLSSIANAGVENQTDMPYEDGQFPCISQEKAQKYVNDFSIDVQSFGGLELCQSRVDTKKLFNDLQILEEGRFNPQTSNKLIREIIKADQYYSWMKGETRSINRGNDIPYATAYNSWGNFTMQDGWAALSTLGRVGTVVHEARHTAGYRHYVCNQGSYQDTSVSGCDQSYDQKGSHAVEMEYYARVSVQGTNFHPVYKSMARLMAMARANFVFNTPILVKKEALLAVTQDSRAFLLSSGRWVQREMPQVEGQLKRTSFGAVVYKGNQAHVIEMYQVTGHNPDMADSYSYFKMLIGRPEQWKDFEEFDIGTKRYLAGVSPDNKLALYAFGNGAWGQMQNTNINIGATSTLLENGEQGLFMISQTGDIYPVDLRTGRLGSAKNFKWSQNLVATAKLDGKMLALRTDGQIYQQNGNSWVPWEQGKETFADMVNVPIYDAFEVK